jgi:hypothetical protein
MTQENTEAEAVVVKKQLKSIAQLFKEYAVTGKYKSREALADKICARFAKLEQTKNVRGKDITKDKVVAQIGRVLGDINKGREGWWNTYVVVEDENTCKLVAKEQAPA